MPIPQAQIYSTLTNQQQQIANNLQNNIRKGGTPTDLSPDATTNYINKSVATPLLTQYDQVIMPRLKDSFAAVGALMSSRRGFASQQSLQNLQQTIGSELAKAQLQNQQLASQNALAYNNIGANLTGQAHMAIQPYINNSEQANNSGFGVDSQNANTDYNAVYRANQGQAAAMSDQLSGKRPVGSAGGYGSSFSDFLNQMLDEPNNNANPTYGDYPTYSGYNSIA